MNRRRGFHRPSLRLGPPNRQHHLIDNFVGRRRKRLAFRRHPRMRRARRKPLVGVTGPLFLNAPTRIDRATRPHRARARIFGPVPRAGRPIANMRRPAGPARQALVGIAGAGPNAGRLGFRAARQALVGVAAAERNNYSVKRLCHGAFLLLSLRKGRTSLAWRRDANKTPPQLIFELFEALIPPLSCGA